MIALLQRVLHASVSVDKKIIGEIKQGLLLFIGIEKKDNETKADRLVERFLGYRVFSDEQDKMNLSVTDIKGGILLVPQFTLAADTQKGTRPSFSSAATPELGQHLFDYVITQTRQQHAQLATGKFGADMKVDLLNDGPVTFWLQV
ncbi:D-aminoacyl-tRNA deacylase [hydrothermal vent metagenome]|uniref:D-aminoacyl-tRNA deacylase n=1 Tax=hydrothermal vent metagenome TaxID=652676 RepID=A0A3B0ZHB9_9ZZZZ